MDYAALKAELAGAAYAGLADAQAAEALMAPIACTVAVEARAVRSELMRRGKWPAVLIGSVSGTHDASWASCKLLYDFAGEGGVFGTDDASMLAALTAELDAMIAGGVIDAADKAAVLSLTGGFTNRAEQLGLGPVAACDVQTARLV